MSQEQSAAPQDSGDGPLRVLQINSSISRRSGVMSMLMNYFRHVDRSQVVFDFFCYATPDETHRAEIESLGGRCYVTNAGGSIGRIRSFLGQLLSKHAGQYPVAHLHDPILSRFLYPVAHRQGVRSFAVHSHATAYSDSRLRSVRNWLVCRNIGAYSDVRLACSRAAGDFLFGRGGYEELPNAIDVETYRFKEPVRTDVRARLGLDDAPVVGHVGRFSEQKNHRFLIDVYTELARLRPGTRLILVGDGPLRPGIEEIVAERGLADRVLFLGDRKDVAALYQAMDMFLLPSLYEGLPMVGVEAQCAGLPLVCSKEVTDEVAIGEATFLPFETPVRQWAHHVSQALERGRDLSFRAQGAAMTSAAGFDITREADRLTRRYRALAEW
ncbi:glycosyltransferase [uncultured Actinomyces sp.]|uniref:glycosyltransferase n=1 Tax=uncultured Actinomyces sp. TaxID=249061 RepID=UPI0028D3397A|nr:glycosyltransferase [uncultured Actinomyces sp.]